MDDERVDENLIGTLADLALDPLPDAGLEALAGGKPYRRFLHLLCRAMAGPSLELGVWKGETSALMAAAGYLTIGVDKSRADLPDDAPPFAYPHYRFLHCDTLGASAVVHGMLTERKQWLSVVFQDSSHLVEPSRLEWEYYRPLLAPDFAWVCDDISESFRLPDEPHSMVDYFYSLPGTKHRLHRLGDLAVVTP